MTSGETSAVRQGSETLVLLRFTARNGEGKPVDLFDLQTTGIRIGLGDFNSGGVPKTYDFKVLSGAGRAAGWIALVVPPGYYYLAVQRPFQGMSAEPGSFLDADSIFVGLPRWRIEVPQGTPVLYAGSFRLSVRTWWNLLGPDHFDINQGETRIEDERDAATAISRRDAPTLPPPVTRLAVLQTGPVLLGMPASTAGN